MGATQADLHLNTVSEDTRLAMLREYIGIEMAVNEARRMAIEVRDDSSRRIAELEEVSAKLASIREALGKALGLPMPELGQALESAIITSSRRY